ncbi:MAG: hypothetical protein ACPGPS_18150, partial [Rubripirellula sp.]
MGKLSQAFFSACQLSGTDGQLQEKHNSTQSMGKCGVYKRSLSTRGNCFHQPASIHDKLENQGSDLT